MGKVFLSYDHEDAARARPIAEALEKAGHQVWWDRHIRGGAQYSKEIESALKSAEAVVVLWSERSIDSAWVRDEAASGRDSGRLVPVRIDGTEPPLGFRQYQTIELTGRKGRAKAEQLEKLMVAVDALVGASPAVSEPAAPIQKPKRAGRATIILLAGVLLIAAALLALRLFQTDRQSSTVLVTSADGSAASAALARDLFLKLGRLQGTDADAMQLVQQRSGTRADWSLQVSGSTEASKSRASMALTDRNDALLWSKDFERPAEHASEMSQQLAVTAAQILDCAGEAVTSERNKIDQQTLKLYLSGCADYAELSGTSVREVQKVIPTLEQVTKKAPGFKAAWGKLLLAEAEVASNGPPAERTSIRSALHQHLIAAQQVDRFMPEASQAEILLLPSTDFARRMEIVDKAIRRHPDDARLLSLRSKLMMSVGRMGAAVEDAKHAASVDPLSPAVQSAYIFALAQAGRLDQALRELEKAQEVWPGAASIVETRFAIYVRYVDPAVALREMKTGAFRSDMPAAQEALLMARHRPTPQNVDRAIAEALATKPQSIRQIIQAFASFGREAELIERLLTLDVSAQEPFTDVFFRPNTRKLREDPRFMLVAKRTGLLGYWKSSGHWPDFCFDPRLPYECKKVAARLTA